MSDAPQSAQDVSAGTLLQQAREAAGLHAAALAGALKVPVNKLEALEADRYDLLPDLTFARALALSVCRTLKIDPQPVLERLPHTRGTRLVTDDQGINAPFRAAGDGPVPGWREQLSRPVVLAVGALLLAALVLIFLPVARRDEAPQPVAGSGTPADANVVVTEVTPNPVATAPQGTGATGGEVAPGAGAGDGAAGAAGGIAAAPAAAGTGAPGATAGAVPLAGGAGAAGTTLSSPAAPGTTPAGPAAANTTPAGPVAGAPASPATAAPAAGAAPGTAAPAGGIVVLRARTAPTWVQVTDASGSTVLQRLLQPGEAVGAEGRPPLSVVVGNASATDVEVRGKPFSLAPVARDNVARFQVQ